MPYFNTSILSIEGNNGEGESNKIYKDDFLPLPPLAPVKAGSNHHGKEKFPHPLQ
jgi:hypothetical protein